MVKERRRWIVPGLAVAAAASVGWIVLRDTGPAVAPSASAAEVPKDAGRREPDLPRIDLARLESPKSRSGAGRRDLFDFGVPPAPPPTPPPVIVATPVGPPLPPPPPTPTPLPPLTVRYVGAIEDKRGLKVAVFLTDKEEVLTGQAGQLVGNRFRIVRIGLESVDIQEVGSDQTRRVPLGGK